MSSRAHLAAVVAGCGDSGDSSGVSKVGGKPLSSAIKTSGLAALPRVNSTLQRATVMCEAAATISSAVRR